MKAIFTGKTIDLSVFDKPKHLCKCDECNEVVNTSFGDPREKVFTYESKEQINPYYKKLVSSTSWNVIEFFKMCEKLYLISLLSITVYTSKCIHSHIII